MTMPSAEGGLDERPDLSKQLAFADVARCYVCNGHAYRPEFERFFFGRRFTWVRCLGCGLVLQNPKLSRESLRAVYNSSTYWKAGRPDGDLPRLGYVDYETEDRFRLRQAGRRLRIVARFLPTGSSILDVACAGGVFVKAAKDAGMKARGIDLSAAMADFGRRAYGVEIDAADFELYEARPAAFDGLTIWGSDSNFFNPRDAFGRARAQLRPGGFVFFNFWDFDHPARFLLGEFKKSYNALYHFNRANVVRLLADVGFAVRSIRMEWQYVSLASVFDMTSRRRLRSLVHRLGCEDVVVCLPTLSGYVVAAQKIS